MSESAPTPTGNPHAGITLLIAGATGQVGSALLELALDDPRVARVTAPTRRALPPHPHLDNPIVNFDTLPETAAWWSADAAACALGTTLRLAGSRTAFRRVDFDYVTTFARLARAHGARAFALTSSLGADPGRRNLYQRTKGETEAALAMLGYPSLTLVRPSLLDGVSREEPRPGETAGLWLGRRLRPLIPPRYRPVAVTRVATALLEAVLLALPGVKAIESEVL